MIKVKLGTMKGSSKHLQIADCALNRHVMFVGKSGSGKTVASWIIAENIAIEGASVLAIDYSGSLLKMEDGENIRRIKVFEDGIPISLFTPIKRPDGTIEDISDITESIVDIFSDVASLGVRQKAALRKAVMLAAQINGAGGNEIHNIGRALKVDKENAAETVYDRFYNLFSKVKVINGKNLYESGQITILDLSGFSTRTQRLLTELTLAILWRYFRAWGQYKEEDLYILFDEFQVLSLRQDGILSQMLREGRKYHIALLLATQTLESFRKEQQAVIQQVGTQLYFRPAESEISHVLKWIGVEKSSDIRNSLKTLNQGECIAVGRFEFSGRTFERPIKMSFRNDYLQKMNPADNSKDV